MILAFIEEYRSRMGYAPTVREIGEAVGLSSTSAVHHHLSRLRSVGALRMDSHRARSVVVKRPADPTLGAAEIEMAWCLSTHGQRPPRVRPCKRHRVMAEWLAEIVLPKARALVVRP